MPRTPKPTKPMKGVELKVMTYEGKRPKYQDVLESLGEQIEEIGERKAVDCEDPDNEIECY